VGSLALQISSDNLSTLVAEQEGRLVRFIRASSASFCEYNFFPRASNPPIGWEKGKVERANDYGNRDCESAFSNAVPANLAVFGIGGPFGAVIIGSTAALAAGVAKDGLGGRNLEAAAGSKGRAAHPYQWRFLIRSVA
jgi:hypothetical protein